MSYRKIINFWGAHNLSRAQPELLESINISDKSKQFLIEVGLPRELDLFYKINFYLEDDVLPRLDIKNYLPPKLYYKYQAIKQPIIIGSEDNIYDSICIFELDEYVGGYVYSVGIDKEMINGIYFMNSSVEQLAEFFYLYQNYHLKAERENKLNDEEKYYHLTEELAYEMYKVDARVFESEDNWWRLILEKMYDGLI